MPLTYVPKYYKLYRHSTKLTNERLIKLDLMLIDLIDNKLAPAVVYRKYEMRPNHFRSVLSIQRKRGLVVDIREGHCKHRGVSNPSLLQSSPDSPPKLSESTIANIRTLYATGLSQRQVAEKMGLSQSSVAKFTRRDSYRSERADPTEPYGGPHA